MNLIKQFNESYAASNGNELAAHLYSAFNYGSNAFCFKEFERLQGANDAEAVTPRQKIMGF